MTIKCSKGRKELPSSTTASPAQTSFSELVTRPLRLESNTPAGYSQVTSVASVTLDTLPFPRVCTALFLHVSGPLCCHPHILSLSNTLLDGPVSLAIGVFLSRLLISDLIKHPFSAVKSTFTHGRGPGERMGHACSCSLLLPSVTVTGPRTGFTVNSYWNSGHILE